MAASDTPVIIIRRKKKGGHGGHHGGAWKVAYADFVTAMMAFFLLLWLLNVTTDVERKGIADYFAPASIAKSESGAGGAMGGHTLTDTEGYVSSNSPPTVEETMIATAGQGEKGDRDVKGKTEGGNKDGNGAGEKKGAELRPDEAAINKAIAEREKAEQERFKAAEDALKQAIKNSPELKELADQLIIDHTPEGLRIQIIDKDNFSMFPSGGSVPYEKSRNLLRMVGQVIARLPNEISVSGHTDSKPFPLGARRDNWSLSTERANVSRQELVYAGFDPNKVARVVGMADRDPYDRQDPLSSKNRRISIVLLRDSLLHPVKSDEPAAPDLEVKPVEAPAPTPPPTTPQPANQSTAPSPALPSTTEAPAPVAAAVNDNKMSPASASVPAEPAVVVAPDDLQAAGTEPLPEANRL